MIWCFVSNILFDCNNQKAHGLAIASLNGDVIVSFSIIGFVDDSTCVTDGNRDETVNQLLVRVKYDAQLWLDLLWASGSKLKLQKCGFHLIFYDFDNNGVLQFFKKRCTFDALIAFRNE